MTTSCESFYCVKAGDGCSKIASQHGISLGDFYAWNPAVGSNCKGHWADVYVCVGIIGSSNPSTIDTPAATSSVTGVVTPSPTQRDMVANCNSFYLVQPGDGCAAIASDHSISLANFLAWNPAVGSNCESL